ncbi:MAG TPA: hypothetical protein VFW11_22510 [Cyclobacteriaceae bacterium]|nr:hypothetical protein [Cyclobacteriaceae bacterium]
MTGLAYKAALPNPLLEPLAVLIGEWETIGSHPYLPGITLHGRASFSWIDQGAFLMLRSENDEGKIPSGISIFGSDDATGELFMLYFDERKVSRKYEVSFHDKVLRWWRNDPAFSQRFTCEITHNDTMIAKGEMCKEGTIWEKDLELTYRRVN